MSENNRKEENIETKSIEELFGDLENLLARLERGTDSLEEAFVCYEQGLRMVRACDARLDKVEKQIRILQEEGLGDGI
ncbi:MAG: exodeoxyribonuclease VII small subunit [bacterium]|nr:exodeoxyribonuclease VII small subunit [bacterium]